VVLFARELGVRQNARVVQFAKQLELRKCVRVRSGRRGWLWILGRMLPVSCTAFSSENNARLSCWSYTPITTYSSGPISMIFPFLLLHLYD
jgi:hypothetical protein